MTNPHAVDPSWVAARNAALLADPAARVAGNAVATTDVERLTLDRAILTSIDTSVSDLIPDAAVTDQKHSGRCWAFAGLNVLRAALMRELNLESVELSQSFVYFHDKLEKAAAFLARAVGDAERPLDDREVADSLRDPIGDGGWWPEFARLVAKYGMVPHYAMPDADSATSSEAMNDHLATLLRRTVLRLRAAAAAGEDLEPIRAAALADVHRVLVIHLGAPPAEFVWQYRDRGKVFHRVGALTPVEFARRYVSGLEEFVVVAHDPRPEIPLNTRFGIDRTDLMVGEPTQEHVTAELGVLKAAAVAAIQDGEPVWFACDVAKQRDKESGVWDAALHDYEGLYGVKLSMTKAERLVARESALTHAMCLTGVDLVDGAPRRWRVENSWGDKVGEKGFHTMNDSWFDEYVYQVVVRARRLPPEVRAALDAEPIILPSWDPMA
ncbi:aminopeptidase C [Actinomyces israelii]|uniref:aminopeptidase C n=1 Tax=Actinomyces israelii TaxID=1659 RepID=UPI002353B6A1|nr:C1 family peptidase [Actinomyces israelii]